MDIHTITTEFYDHSLYFKGLSKQTIKRYKYTIDSYVRIIGVKSIDKVTPENVRTLFFLGRSERNWSVNTTLVFHKSLQVFFSWCIGKGYISFNPMDDIEKPKLEHKLPKSLTKHESLRLLELVANLPYNNKFLRYRNYAIIAMFIHAGLRKMELLNLKYSDVDLDTMTIFVNQGKGAKDRFVPISGTLAKILGLYLFERKRHGKTCPEFFSSSTRNKGFTPDGLKHFIDALQPIFGKRFSVHRLRHTFATLMIEGGCDIYSLSKMMGHTDIKTTTIYLSASAEHLRGQIGKHPMNEINQGVA